jgi:hypothetical protein
VFDCTGEHIVLLRKLSNAVDAVCPALTGAPWQDTLDALLSNTPERSDSITLVFERELP